MTSFLWNNDVILQRTPPRRSINDRKRRLFPTKTFQITQRICGNFFRTVPNIFGFFKFWPCLEGILQNFFTWQESNKQTSVILQNMLRISYKTNSYFFRFFRKILYFFKIWPKSKKLKMFGTALKKFTRIPWVIWSVFCADNFFFKVDTFWVKKL